MFLFEYDTQTVEVMVKRKAHESARMNETMAAEPELIDGELPRTGTPVWVYWLTGWFLGFLYVPFLRVCPHTLCSYEKFAHRTAPRGEWSGTISGREHSATLPATL